MKFDFIAKHKIPVQPKERFKFFYPLSEDLYALIDNTEKSTIHFYNQQSNKTKKISYEGFIAPISANTNPFREYNGKLYFYPPEINNYIFTINSKILTLSKAYQIENTYSIKKEDIKKFKGNTEEISSFISTNSTKYTPLNRFISDRYIYTLLLKQNEQYINIFNIKSGKSYTFSKNPSYDKNIPNCHYIEGETIYAIIQPFEIYDFIDTSLLLNKDILLILQEDSNLFVVKYKLKI